MENPLFPGNSASALSPSTLATGDNRRLVPPIPPDSPDPDPSNPLSLALFPPLNSPASKTPKNYRASLRSPSLSSTGKASVAFSTAGTVVPAKTSTSAVSESFRSESGSQSTVHLDLGNFKILPPKSSSPIQTNRALKPSQITPPPNKPPSLPCLQLPSP